MKDGSKRRSCRANMSIPLRIVILGSTLVTLTIALVPIILIYSSANDATASFLAKELMDQIFRGSNQYFEFSLGDATQSNLRQQTAMEGLLFRDMYTDGPELSPLSIHTALYPVFLHSYLRSKLMFCASQPLGFFVMYETDGDKEYWWEDFKNASVVEKSLKIPTGVVPISRTNFSAFHQWWYEKTLIEDQQRWSGLRTAGRIHTDLPSDAGFVGIIGTVSFYNRSVNGSVAQMGVCGVGWDRLSMSNHLVHSVSSIEGAMAYMESDEGVLMASSDMREETWTNPSGPLFNTATSPNPVIAASSMHSSDDDFSVNDKRFLLLRNQVDYLDRKASLVVLVPRHTLLSVYTSSVRIATGLAVIIILIAVIIALLLARWVAKPVVRLTSDLAALSYGRKMSPVELDDRSSVAELASLQGAFSRLTIAMQAFSVFTPSPVLQHVLDLDWTPGVNMRESLCTVMFIDIVGYTELCEKSSQEELLSVLSSFYDTVTCIITAHGGIIDKFIGDAAMALFLPDLCTEPEASACLASVQIADAIAGRPNANRGSISVESVAVSTDALLTDPVGPELDCRIGLATGIVLVGTLGTRQRLNYSVIGDIVNTASRIESLNRLYGTRILIDQATADAATKSWAGLVPLLREVDYLKVKGKSRPTRVLELMGDYCDVQDDRFADFRNKFAHSLACFRAGRFSEAADGFMEAAALRPGGDHSCQEFLRRCRELQSSVLPPGWDGTYTALSK